MSPVIPNYGIFGLASIPDPNNYPPIGNPTPTSTPTSTTTQTPTNTSTPTTTPTPTSTTTVPISCNVYSNDSGNTWTGDYVGCDGTEYFSVSLLDGQNVCARTGSPFTLAGTDLTIGSPC